MVVLELTFFEIDFQQPIIPVFDNEHLQLPVSEWKIEVFGKMLLAKNKRM